MSQDPFNPFAAPTTMPANNAPLGGEFLPPKSIAKVEAVIKDASQFWLAI